MQETTSLTITWILAYVLRHPAVQQQIHAELDSVIGGADKQVTLADKPQLPFLNAVIMESQRCANLLGQNLTRVAAQDCTVEGFRISKGTVVLPQISVMMLDEKVSWVFVNLHTVGTLGKGTEHEN